MGYTYHTPALTTVIVDRKHIECKKCKNNFSTQRKTELPVNTYRCPKCGCKHGKKRPSKRMRDANSSELDFELPRIKKNVSDYTENKTAIYIIEGKRNIVKIGISKDPKKRLRGLKTGSPYELELLATNWSCMSTVIETRLHVKYKQYQLSGEWFKLPENELVKLIGAVRHGKLG